MRRFEVCELNRTRGAFEPVVAGRKTPPTGGPEMGLLDAMLGGMRAAFGVRDGWTERVCGIARRTAYPPVKVGDGVVVLDHPTRLWMVRPPARFEMVCGWLCHGPHPRWALAAADGVRRTLGDGYELTAETHAGQSGFRLAVELNPADLSETGVRVAAIALTTTADRVEQALAEAERQFGG